MKKTVFSMLVFLNLLNFNVKAQCTQASNNIAATSFVGTSSASISKDVVFMSNGVEVMRIKQGGNVAIGATSTFIPQNKLEVCGTIRAKEVKVETGWCDYVFYDSYQLMPLAEVKQYIQENQHLPEIPSANDIETNGVLVADMLRLHMKKIEELTLYIIQQDEKINLLEKQVSLLQAK